MTFKKLCSACVNNSYYGKYSRLNNLEVIVENLVKKQLEPTMKKLVDIIVENMDIIKTDILRDRSAVLENIINLVVNEATI